MSIADKNVITNKFNEFFIDVGSNLASEILPILRTFNRIFHISLQFFLGTL